MYAFPHLEKGFNMYTSLVEEFVRNNHEVCVLAPGNEKSGVVVEQGIEILRVGSLPAKNASKYLKGLSNILMPYFFHKEFNTYYSKRKFDLIISPTPPITFAGLISKIKKRNKAKFYLILRDIFPQNAVDLKYFRKNSLYNLYFRHVEKKYYKIADYIGCMSQGNIDYMAMHNPFIPVEKLHVFRNFQKIYMGNRQLNQVLRKEFGLGDNFIAVFGGNMGLPQQLENVLELAKRCLEYSDVRFLLLGEGYEMERISKKVIKEKFSNIIIRGSLPKSKYQDLLSLCDLGLISLHQDFTIPNIPSKILDYLNVGIPVLASIDRCTDFDKVLTETGAGFFSYAGDHESFKKNFDRLYKDKNLRKRMGEAGHLYYKSNLLPDQAYKTIIEQVS